MQQIHAGSPELVQRSGLRGRQQPERRVERAGLQVGLRRRQHALGAAGRIDRQVGRPPQERGRGGEPAAGLRPARRALELGRDVLVGPARGLRAVPGAAIRLERGIGHVRQRAVHALALEVRGRPVDRRAHERMAEAHLRADVQQPGPRRGLERRAGDPEPRRGAPHQRRIADRLRRRDQQQQPRLVGQLLEPPQEALLDPARQRQRLRQPEPARQLRRREPARELQQRERVAARLGDDPVADALVEPARDDGREQRRGRPPRPSPPSAQLRQAHQLALVGRARARRTRSPPTPPAAVARRSPRTWPEAPSSHCASSTKQSSGRSSATSASRLSAAKRDQEAVGGIAGREAERDAQGALLGLGKRVEPLEHRRAELMQPGERQLHLGLDARDLRDPKAGRLRERSSAGAPSCRRPPRRG